MSVRGFSDLFTLNGLDFLNEHYSRRLSDGRTTSTACPKRNDAGYTITWDFNIHNPSYKEKYPINSEYNIELSCSVGIPHPSKCMAQGMFEGIIISMDTLREIIQDAMDKHEHPVHKCVGYLSGIDKSNDRPFDIEIGFHYEKLNLFAKRISCIIPTDMAEEWYETYVKFCQAHIGVSHP
jgi:hypothetical protein